MRNDKTIMNSEVVRMLKHSTLILKCAWRNCRKQQESLKYNRRPILSKFKPRNSQMTGCYSQVVPVHVTCCNN